MYLLALNRESFLLRKLLCSRYGYSGAIQQTECLLNEFPDESQERSIAAGRLFSYFSAIGERYNHNKSQRSGSIVDDTEAKEVEKQKHCFTILRIGKPNVVVIGGNREVLPSRFSFFLYQQCDTQPYH